MEDMLTSLVTYGYIGLFLYSLGGGFIALMAAAVLASQGKMDLGLAMGIAFVGNFIGDTLLFYMAHYHKSDIRNYLRKHRRKLALSHILMKKYGSWVIFLQKFVYGIKTLIPLAIGITKYPFARFSILNFLATIVWTVVIGFGSYLAGDVLMSGYEVIAQRPYLAPIIIFTLGGSIWYYMHWATKKR
ncbi:MAG: DedA family protein [Sulfurimonadaceae bacterium]